MACSRTASSSSSFLFYYYYKVSIQQDDTTGLGMLCHLHSGHFYIFEEQLNPRQKRRRLGSDLCFIMFIELNTKRQNMYKKIHIANKLEVNSVNQNSSLSNGRLSSYTGNAIPILDVLA
jgi:hypothetical protein